MIYRTFNTIQILNTNIDFTITPFSGTSELTNFTLRVQKNPGDELWCRLGFNLTNGVKYIDWNTDKVFSD